MIVQGYRYIFLNGTILREAEKTLLLATVAAEGLHGESVVRMDASYVVDEKLFTISVDASTVVGENIASIFTAFLTKELDQSQFSVGRIYKKEDQE